MRVVDEIGGGMGCSDVLWVMVWDGDDDDDDDDDVVVVVVGLTN